MAAFADSSGLIKLYVPEIGSDWMTADIRPDGIIISDLAITETGSALSRMARSRVITDSVALEAWRLFRRELRTFITVQMDRWSLVRAAHLIARSSLPLRTLDAIHLHAAQTVAARAVRDGFPPPLFVSADTRLLAAAAALGLATENPLNHP